MSSPGMPVQQPRRTSFKRRAATAFARSKEDYTRRNLALYVFENVPYCTETDLEQA